MLNRISIISLTVLATLAADHRPAHMSEARASNSGVLAHFDDAALLAEVAQKDSAEIVFGSVAVERGRGAGVKELGRVLVRDHTAHLKAVRALASRMKLSVGVDQQSADQQHDLDMAIERLRTAPTEDFDASFVDLIYETHAGGLTDLREELIPAAQDARVKQLLNGMFGPMSAHLGMAKKLRIVAVK